MSGDVGADVAAAEICPRASGPCSSCVAAVDRILASDWFAERVEAAKAEALREAAAEIRSRDGRVDGGWLLVRAAALDPEVRR